MRGAIPEARGREVGREVQFSSRLVRLAKIGLPLAVLALIGALFLSMRPAGDLADIFSPEDLAKLGAGLRLDHPRFNGVTDAGEPFSIRADAALPDGAMPTYIDLERPRGEIVLKDGRKITVVAESGRLHRKDETVTLEGGVTVENSDGYRMATRRVEIDLAAETANAPDPVSGAGPQGTIEAMSARAAAGEGGAAEGKIWFENRVRLVFIPAKGADPAAKSASDRP